MSDSRNNSSVDRRTFVRDAALAAAAACPMGGMIGGLSGLLAQARPHNRRTVNGIVRPFNMICLGDSVMWGQGLQDSHKFSAQVEDWLRSKLQGRLVNRYVYARSGATIGPDKDVPDRAHAEPWMNDRRYEEVPASWPWVQEQVSVAKSDLDSRVGAAFIDLVLLNGGANDMGITALLDSSKTPDQIRQMSTDKVAGQMPALLQSVGYTFPNAKILVTGYYPVISEDSDLAGIGMFLALITGTFAVPLAASLPLPIAAIPVTLEMRRSLTATSAAWYDASNTDLQAAVAQYNSKRKTFSSSATFVKIPWGPNHCYAAPDSRLWLLGLPEDEVYPSRASACGDTGQTPKAFTGAMCIEAKSGHPNPAGATAYAAACRAQLARYLPEWNGLKALSACVTMDPMPRPGIATTLTVSATATGPTGVMKVPATVRIGTQSFASDTPVPMTLCVNHKVTAIDQSGLKPTREQLGTTLSCQPITVSAPGYTDVVITKYLSAQALP